MKYKQIPKNDLIPGRWYIGRGRNNNVGYWNGEHFITIGMKYNHWDVKIEPYYEDEKEENKSQEFILTLGTFQPFLLIDEGEIIPFGESGWDKHYGTELII